MKRIAIFLLFAFLKSAAGQTLAAPAQTDTASAQTTTLPAGTRVELTVTAPVWARSAKPGDALYTQVDFPVLAGKTIAIPAGTYVQGTIQSITKPSHFRNHAEIQALFTTVIFANGYAVPLPGLSSMVGTTQPASSATISPAPTLMKLNIEVTASNDLLLDDGAQFYISLASPLSLDSKQLVEAAAVSRPVDVGQFKSATLCRPTPGTPGSPGSPDTVIPGSPGTPDTTIPGGPGMPDIVIPGTPATPPTVIPGTPGTPGFAGRACPNAPLVISSVPIPTSPPSSQPSTARNP